MEYHTRNGFHFYGNAIEDAKNKVLKANVILYPKSTIKRILKYVEKGYKVDRKLIKALWNSVLAGADDEFEY
jgi:hypothetical protein